MKNLGEQQDIPEILAFLRIFWENSLFLGYFRILGVIAKNCCQKLTLMTFHVDEDEILRMTACGCLNQFFFVRGWAKSDSNMLRINTHKLHRHSSQFVPIIKTK